MGLSHWGKKNQKQGKQNNAFTTNTNIHRLRELFTEAIKKKILLLIFEKSSLRMIVGRELFGIAHYWRKHPLVPINFIKVYFIQPIELSTNEMIDKRMDYLHND